METQEILERIRNAKPQTPVKVFIQGQLSELDFGPDCKVINMGHGGVVIGDWEDIKGVLQESDAIEEYHIETDRRNSAITLLDTKDLGARIEPGAIIREAVTIETDAIVMMGACINIGASIGAKTLIDMNAVIGGRAKIGRGCHIGAGTVIKGVISSPHAQPVVIKDNVVIGPNAVILEGVTIGAGAIIGPGSIITRDVQEKEVIPSGVY
ncbi:2,3,4,5-tetrahydropyridine-2,6-dicarboxylate N-acetyltransferase [Ammoniphilus sp. YIM 78166]|uniref:2,3,4,5-tetrahydropyridine-2,6-dicarboxylate N-acetyltransferase n=1 Tax=Ammoniphilus sp. YIM 78166 TaxID=1644106 RepID=UPI00106FAB81|nr:2,3,4,5-tetrahydropyridine-2,6-dicarboxylate N-acetyltransferase [Ammoniphilus sp. YIM 78166]